MNSGIEETKHGSLKSIRAINKDTVHKICSGQVVLSLAVAVKELVENSLDAGATNIDVRLKNYGIDLIEVSDNGSGVHEHNFTSLTLKHHTSKLNEYSDLLDVSSFGFRGEALSSLCALAKLTITTRDKIAGYATKIEYDHDGIITKKTPCSRLVGTTVSLSNLFYSLPVRQKEFHKNVKREFNRMTQLLYAYCLISLGVKITCTNQTSSNSKSIVVATQGSMCYKDNIACVFGVKQLQSILEIKPEYGTNIIDNIFRGLSQEVANKGETVEVADIEMDLSENDSGNEDESINISQKTQGYKNMVSPVEFTGYISSCVHGCGRSSTDRQFYYVNCRPCEPPKIMKQINEIYKKYNPNQYPFVFLNVNLERTSVDVNVTPDKRKIFLTKEKAVLDVLKNSLHKLFQNIPSTLKVDNSIQTKFTSDLKPNVDQPRIFHSFLQQFSKKSNSFQDNYVNDEIGVTQLKRKSTSLMDFISSSKVKKTENDQMCAKSLNNFREDIVKSKEDESKSRDCNSSSEDIESNFKESSIEADKSSSNTKQILETSSNSDKTLDESKQDIMYLEYTDNLPNTQIRNLDEVIIEKSHTTVCKTKTPNSKAKCSPAILKKTKTDKEDLGKTNRRSVTLKTSFEHVKALAEIYNRQKTKSAPERVKFKSAINPVCNKKCEEELSKEISKDSFKLMSVIGQLNLGFIITKLEDDLFIIDQHATDEIYNFETLQKTTELTNQKLVIAQQLELTGVNEQILMDNLDVFKKNGFTFEINENAEPTKRVKLLTIPMSKNWIFGKEDIEELLFMLRESSSEYCRPSRVRAMFASRACRKSVMIGTALSKTDMKKLVDHMAEIEKPWNCPHGRPTIRHLVNLAMVHTHNDEAL